MKGKEDDHNASDTSLVSLNATTTNSKDLGSFLAQRVQGLLFSGWYTDRVLVEPVACYRDRIRVDPGEINVLKQLKSVKRRVKKEHQGIFDCLEKHDDSVSLLVNWPPSSQAFGHFWFCIDKVEIVNEKLLEWRIRVVRSVLQGDKAAPDKCRHCGKYPHESGANETSSALRAEDPLTMTDIMAKFQHRFKDWVDPIVWGDGAKTYLTWENVMNCVRFVVILGLALGSGIANLLPKLWHMLNVTLRELGMLIRQFTPFMLACVDMMSKVVGGFYMLIAMVWKDVQGKPSSQREALQPQVPPRHIQMDPKLGAVNRRSTFLEGPRYPYRRENVQRPYYTRN